MSEKRDGNGLVASLSDPGTKVSFEPPEDHIHPPMPKTLEQATNEELCEQLMLNNGAEEISVSFKYSRKTET